MQWSHFGIRFKPAILFFLLNQRCDKFTNKIIPLKDISILLHDKLNFEETDENIKVSKLNVIFEELFANIKLNQTILLCIEKIVALKGDVSIVDITKEFNINQKQLERKFTYHIGFTPKKFIRIIRFFNSHKNIIKNGIDSLCDTAYELGYFDQSHFNKDYKNFTQISPTDKTMSIFYNTKK